MKNIFQHDYQSYNLCCDYTSDIDCDYTKNNILKNEYIKKQALLLSYFCGMLYLLTLKVGAANSTQFDVYLESGVFEDTGKTSWLVDFVYRMVDLFFENALPIMSILAISFVLMTLIATVAYLLRQDYFDIVYLAKRMNKEDKNKTGVMQRVANRDFKGMFSNSAVSQYGFFKVYIMPNCKALAFREATEGPMTVKEFFQENLGKCVFIFGFCMVIGDRTMLDLFSSTGKVGVYFIDKLAHDVPYVEMIDNVVTAGSDYSPPWGTERSNVEGRNKTKVYDAVYKALKTKCQNDVQRSTEYKTQMGESLVSYIESSGLKTVPWGRKNFSVSASYISNKTVATDSTSERFYVPVSLFGFVDDPDGVIGIYIISSEDKTVSGVVKTTHEECWSANGNTYTLDLSKGFAPVIQEGVTGHVKINSVSAVRVTGATETKMLTIGNGVKLSKNTSGTGLASEDCVLTITPGVDKLTSISVVNIDYTTWQSDGKKNVANKYNNKITINYKVNSVK